MLSKFHKNIIIFLCVLLIIISIIFYRNFLYLLSNTSFPRYINECPDHWDLSYNSNGEHVCYSSHLNQLSDGQPINLSRNKRVRTDLQNDLTSNNGKYKLQPNFEFKDVYKKNNYCALYEWSKQNNIHWSGITNSNYTKYC